MAKEVYADSMEGASADDAKAAEALVGVMAQNTAATAKESHVWSTGHQKRG